MKRITCLLCAAVLLLLAACGAGDTPESPSPTPSESVQVTVTPEPSPEPTPPEELVVEPPAPTDLNPLTGLPSDSPIADQKPVAIMLNNIKAAMPQQGNSQADILYEVLAEGGITRMLGVYQDISQLDTVGSIRSARLYYLELAMGHDAVYVHAGGSPEFYDYTKAHGMTTVDGVNGYYAYSSTGLFWRNRERVDGNYYAYEHSLITDGAHLTDTLTSRGLLGPHSDGYTYEMSFDENALPVDGDTVDSIKVNFSNYKSTTFNYDRENDRYLVEQYDSAYIDGNDGAQISVRNVIILKTKCTVVDDAGRLTVDLTSGEGHYSCGGSIRPITWEKGAADQPLKYYDEFGQPLTLRPGKTYVCIIPLSRNFTFSPAQ